MAVVLEGLLAFAALGGAITLIADGESLGSVADDLPWQSPVLGGIALGVVNVLVPVTAILGTLRGTRWAPVGRVVVGPVLVVWIAVQIAFIGLTSWLQPIMVAYGIALTLLAIRQLPRHQHVGSRTAGGPEATPGRPAT